MGEIATELVPGGIRCGDWEIECCKTHMLESWCHEKPPCSREEPKCRYCKFNNALKIRPPDEVYDQNKLSIRNTRTHQVLEFNALQALLGVDADNDPIKIAVTEEWAQSRKQAHRDQYSKVMKAFDWTYTTTYDGSVSEGWKVDHTDERIDMESLKQREKILFHDNVFLFADDFGDNGAAMMNVRIRVMPSSFFVLQRLFIRVDKVIVRVIDTRVYHKFGTDYLLREFTFFESPAEELEIKLKVNSNDPRAIMAMYHQDMIPQIIPHMEVKQERFDKLTIPS